MKLKEQTKIAKDFLFSVDLNRIYQVLEKINFNPREKIILRMMMEKKSIKEMSVQLNLSLSHIAYLKQGIYKKIFIYLQLKNKNT